MHAQDPGKNDPSFYHRFETRAYWGDVALFDSTISEERVAELTAWDWLAGAEPRVAGEYEGYTPRGPIGLRLEADSGATLPSIGYPVRTGVPFAEGMLRPEDAIELRDATGSSELLQTQVLSTWDDGSVRWMLLDFTATPDQANGRYRIHWQGVDPTRYRAALRVDETETDIHVQTGAVEFTVPRTAGDSLLRDVKNARGDSLVERMLGIVDCRRQPDPGGEPDAKVERYRATVDSATIESGGPIRATIRIDGQLVSETGDVLGPVTVRVHAYAGLPYIHVLHRVTNASDAYRRLDLSRLTFVAADAPWRGFEDLTVTEVPRSGDGPDGIRATDGFGIGVRHFWQQYPKAIVADAEGLHADLYHSTGADNPQNWFSPGEAKRHELMLTFADDEADNLAALATLQNPPRLFDKRWHCQSGGWGPAMWRDASHFADHHEQMRRKYSHLPAQTTRGNYGLRDFGDWQYGGAETWFGNYYDPQYSQFAEYLMGGGPEWFQRAEAMCRHNMDIDHAHDNAARPDMVGGITGYSARHHNVESFSHLFCFSTKGYLAYYHLTGDPVALETAKERAAHIIANKFGISRRSARDHAFTMTALLDVYRETREPDVLAGAAAIFEDSLKMVTPRRGTYIEHHGTHNYPGGIAWLCGQLMESYTVYWHMTRDERAREALVALASATYCENMGGPDVVPLGQHQTRGKLGVTTYSPNPFMANWSSGYVFLTATGWAHAFDLTGRREFLDAARAGYEAAVEEDALTLSTYWQAPWLLHYLSHPND